MVLHSAAALLLVLCKTSPSGPPIEVPQEMGIQLACLWFGSLAILPPPTPSPICIGSNSRDNLNGERVTFSLFGEEVDDMKSAGAMGIEIDSWVLSDC